MERHPRPGPQASVGVGVLDFQSIGGITSWLPLFLFVILFGLSMDYHVLILSRIREAVDRGMSTDEAVSHETMIGDLERMGFDFDDTERLEQIGGRWRGERMTSWARAEIGWAHAMADAGRGTMEDGSFSATEGPPLRT